MRSPDFLLTLLALALEIIAVLLLLTNPPSNSHLWSPINIGRFGGVIAAGIALALTVQALAEHRIRADRSVILISLNSLALVIGTTSLNWETRG